MKRYLIILFEDNAIWQTDILSEDDKVNAEDGLITIINTTIGKEYVDNGNWQDIQVK